MSQNMFEYASQSYFIESLPRSFPFLDGAIVFHCPIFAFKRNPFLINTWNNSNMKVYFYY